MAQGWRSVFPYKNPAGSPWHLSKRLGVSTRRLAQEIFHFHTKGLTFDPKRSGAEWWVQIRDAGARFCSFLCQAGLGFSGFLLAPFFGIACHAFVGLCYSSIQDSGHEEEGIQFHWDTDEAAVERQGINVHPHLSILQVAAGGKCLSEFRAGAKIYRD